MSYSIIFETKIIKLKDGRLLHLDLSGCNNDNAGRSRDEFTGKIYTPKAFIERAEKFKKDSVSIKQSDAFDLKIGSRYCTWYDYGEHLLRMMKRAETWDELNCAGRYVRIMRIDGAEVHENNKTTVMSIQEFDDFALKNIFKGFRYSILRTELRTEDDVVEALDNEQTVHFCIGKKRKVKKG